MRSVYSIALTSVVAAYAGAHCFSVAPKGPLTIRQVVRGTYTDPRICSGFSRWEVGTFTPVPANPHDNFDPVRRVLFGFTILPNFQANAVSSAPEFGASGTGTYDFTKQTFTLEFGNGTYAGFNVTSKLTYTINGLTGTGAASFGDKGQLPQAISSDYTVTGTAGLPMFTAQCGASLAAGEPISTASGELYNEYPPDLELGGGPLEMRFQRYYGTLLKFNGITSALGANWMHNFDMKLYVVGQFASVVRFGGKLVRFQQSGGTWQVIQPERYQDQLITGGSESRYFSVFDNLIYAFDTNGNLTRIQDRNGNQITVTPGPNGPAQASDGLGRTLTFTYNNGNLVKVADQAGRSVNFVQTGTDLTSFTDAVGKTTKFAYTQGLTGSLLRSTTLPSGAVSFTQAYDSLDHVSKQTDALNNTTASLAYNSPGAGQTSVTDAAGNKTVYANTVQPATTTGYTDALGKSGAMAYDSSGHRTTFTDRNGNKVTTTYQSAGLPATVTDANGNATTYTYSSSTVNGFTFFDLTATGSGDGSGGSTMTLDANGNVVKVTDGSGNSTTYTYNSRGQMLTTVNPAGGKTTMTYNADGSLAGLTTAAGDTATYTYDAVKRVTGTKLADGSTITSVWDALNRLVQRTDERNNITKYTYTDNGQRATVTDPLGNVTTYSYDANGNLISVQSPAGKTTIAYNALNLPATITAPTGETRTFTYDANHRRSATGDAAGTLETLTFDNEDAETTFTDGAGRKWTFTPNVSGAFTTVKTPQGETYTATYDTRNRLTTLKDPLGATTTYAYKGPGLSSETLPGGAQATYGTDILGNVSSITDPNGGVWARTYDNMSRLTSRTDPLGKKVTYTYNSRDQISSITTDAGAVQITHDAAGNLTRLVYPDGTDLAYTFDAANRLTGGTGAAVTLDATGLVAASNGLAVARDGSGRIASLTYPAGKVTYTYNNRGLLQKVTDWTGASVTFAYDASLRVASVSRSNGVKTVYTYDNDGLRASITESGTAAIGSIAVQRNAAGKVTRADRTEPQDPAGSAGNASFAVNAAHEITGDSYDALGQLAKDATRTYTFDSAARLTGYQGADGTAVLTYDAFGNRISATYGAVKQSYVVDYATVLPTVAVVQQGGADQRYYIWSPGGGLLFAVDAAGGAHHFYHFDEAGNTTFLTGDSGAVTDSYGVTAYGEVVSVTGSTPNPFTWQGEYGAMQEGSTSLYYLRARYYDAASGRFISRDPAGLTSAAGIDPYPYAFDDPIQLHDPSGRIPQGGGGHGGAGFAGREMEGATRAFSAGVSRYGNSMLLRVDDPDLTNGRVEIPNFQSLIGLTEANRRFFNARVFSAVFGTLDPVLEDAGITSGNPFTTGGGESKIQSGIRF